MKRQCVTGNCGSPRFKVVSIVQMVKTTSIKWHSPFLKSQELPRLVSNQYFLLKKDLRPNPPGPKLG